MKNLILFFCLLLLTGCFYKDAKIDGMAIGLNDAVVEISDGENSWSENIRDQKFSIHARLKRPVSIL